MATQLTEQPTTIFPAPDASTAPAPAESRGRGRDDVRMLVARPDGVTHAHFNDLPDHLEPGDLVVVNNSATERRQIDADLVGRGPVVLHAATPLGEGQWVVELRSSPNADRAILDASVGDHIVTGWSRVRLIEPYPDGPASPTGTGNRLWRANVSEDFATELQVGGRPIAYGYLDRPYPLEAYQTVFASRPGSAEMPSAARPFTADLVASLVAHGVRVAPITLHTGVSSQEVGEAPGPEWFEVEKSTADLVESTHAEGGRVIAVGTTVTRALESAVDDGHLRAARGWTDRVVTPLHPPQVVDGLITGWHDPQASHLLLVEAVAGPALTQRTYDAAVSGGYLWHEFGDATLLLPDRRGARRG